MRTTPACLTAATAALLVLTGCGSGDDEPTSHPTQDTSITAQVGERFTLSVPENASTREHWYLVDPQPDGSVVRKSDRRYESGDDDAKTVGGAGALVFTFEATGKGSTRIVLLHCTFPTADAKACGGGGPSPSPTTATPSTPPEPERVTYTVTVG